MARKVVVGSGFEYGARVLKVSVDALVKLYELTIKVLQKGIEVGNTNGAMGLLSLHAYFDLLHGGAYAAPINLLPHYAPDKTQSPYYAGNLQNLIPTTWLSWLAASASGESATDMMNEIFEDANVPHVFPKLLSDQAYAQIKLGYAQLLSADIFTKGATGVTTLVQGLEGEAGPSRTPSRTRRRQSRDVNALLSLVGKRG
jgi:hypothetical protein